MSRTRAFFEALGWPKGNEALPLHDKSAPKPSERVTPRIFTVAFRDAKCRSIQVTATRIDIDAVTNDVRFSLHGQIQLMLPHDIYRFVALMDPKCVSLEAQPSPEKDAEMLTGLINEMSKGLMTALGGLTSQPKKRESGVSAGGGRRTPESLRRETKTPPKTRKPKAKS